MSGSNRPGAGAFCLFAALTMSLGWGLRGFIGGGPLGAMIPGALVALALCLLLEREDAEAGLIAAFGAVGVGFGGQETYGQTVGFILRLDTFWWGLAGLSLKGAVWGLLGGAILGAVLAPKRPALREAGIGLALLSLATWAGWRFINQPKLIYFSDPINKPRAELWAGLLLGALVWLAWLAWRGLASIPARFALFGMLGGGIGFGGGGAIMSAGHNLPIGPRWYDWWKVMELVFGFCFGAALGCGAWRLAEKLRGGRRPEACAAPVLNRWLQLLVAAAVVGCVLAAERLLPVRFSYTLIGAAMLWGALRWPSFAWHMAVTITLTAFTIDLIESPGVRQLGSPALAWTLAIAGSAAACGWLAYRLERGRPMTRWAFLFLLWSAVLVSWVKALLYPGPMRAGAVNELLFTVFAAILTAIAVRDFPVRSAKWHRQWLRRLLPAALLNRLNALSHLEDRLYELEARCARLAAVALRERYPDLFRLDPREGLAVYSQHDEDGILLELLAQTGAPVKRFVEIGIEHGRECNTAILGFVLGWDGLMLESDPLGAAAADRLQRRVLKDRPNRIEVRRVTVTPENIDELVGEGEVGVLSIDVDGPDYWLWKAVRRARPRLVIIEYNASLGREAALTVPYQPRFSAASAHWSGYYHGASLAALEKLGREKGYDLVAVCSAGVNAFFVRQDIRPPTLPAARAIEIYRPHAERCRKHSPDEQWALIRHLPYERV